MRKVNFPTVYSTGSTCDESNAKEQMVVKVAAPTAPFTAGDRVMLGRGGVREEEAVIDSIQADVSITLLTNLVHNHTVDANTTVDVESAAEQAVLSVASTSDFLPGETVLVDEGETHEATYIILSVQAGVSLTMTTNLLFTHEVAEAVAQTGIGGVVEICMASLSSFLYKGNHKILAIFLPSAWTSAKITFAGCNTENGTYNQVVKATDIAEVEVSEIAASKVVGLDGIVKEPLEAIPYLKLRSGTSAAPVDQGTSGIVVDIVLGR